MRVVGEELQVIVDKVLERVKQEIYLNNQQDNLDFYLDRIGCNDLISEYNTSFNTRHAKIIVIGDSQISSDIIYAIAKNTESVIRI